MAEHQLEEGNDWVLVKKQKIRILVPPASPICSRIGRSRIRPLQSKSRKKEDRRSCNFSKGFLQQSKAESGKPLGNCSLHECQSQQVDSEALRTRVTHPPDSNGGIVAVTSAKPKGTSSYILGESALRQCSTPHDVDAHNAVSVTRDQFFSTSRFQETVGDSRRLLVGALSVVNRRLKASNLEKRLERLGGLKRYLASIGLKQFIQIFEREKVDKFRLVNLTMRKLKDMGADAVGPRRKLLSAIDCLSQPYLKVS